MDMPSHLKTFTSLAYLIFPIEVARARQPVESVPSSCHLLYDWGGLGWGLVDQVPEPADCSSREPTLRAYRGYIHGDAGGEDGAGRVEVHVACACTHIREAS